MIKKFSRYNPNKISAKDVEAELTKSREEINRQNQRVSYYHGDIDRNVAEKLLKDFYYNNGECKSNHTINSLDGLFLVRKCSASPDDFSLSLINKGQFYHYRINHSIDAYYVLDDGPLIHGLDELIKHYQLDPHGLPCRLNMRFVPRGVLPSKARVVGNTNPLHLTVACVSEINKLKLILKSANRPDINEKDDNGRTALHIACEYDNINAVEELIEANALANIRAKDGSTPLHTAAEFGSIQCLEYLLKSGKVNPMERNMTNNWVALHEASYRDHFTCVNALLNYGLPDKPRTCDNQTPLDLAIENGHKRTISVLRSYISPEPRIRQSDFLHDANVTREVALKLLESSSNKSENANNGNYLVRRTQRDENIMVLSLIYNGEFFNYEICVKDLIASQSQQQQRFYFIDDGPYFRSLSHLIEHYTKYEDGLPGILTKPIHPSSTMNHQNGISGSATKQHHQVKPHHQFSSSTTSSNSSANSGPLNHIQPNVICNMMNMMNFSVNNNNMNGSSCSNQSTPHTPFQNSKSDALLRANLFKSRTLLNDQKRKSKPNTSKKLEKISISEIQIQSTIGEGEFGTVYKAIYNGKQVAIKALKDCTASSDFMREADIMGTLNHPCILKIFGLVQDTEYLMMVQELMICSILEKLWQAPHEITEHHLKIWSSQIALGMQHMEEQKIVHRDLAARNVLLASMYQIKISDFGLSRSTDAFTNAYTQKTEGKIPIKWYSPESIELLKFTSKSDVWSYGITLWELFSYGDQPYGNKSGSEVYMFIQSGQRLERPPSCPLNTYKIMLQCWEWQEEKRPTFKELNQMFQNDSDYQKTLPILKSFR